MVVDNFLEDPEYYYNMSKNQTFYSCEENPTISNGISYKGKRTLFLDDSISKDIINKIIKRTIRHETTINIDCDFNCLFHSFDKTHNFHQSHIHKDTALYAGIIYINKNVTQEMPNNGTVIYLNNREIVVPYLYNRLVFYRSDVPHSALNGFGETIDESRLSITMFLSTFNVNVVNKLIKKMK